MIRLATEADLPEIVAIYNQSVPKRNATADLQEVSVADRQTWFAGHQKPARPIFVWVENNSVLGWASLSDYYPRAAYHISAEASVYVASAAQGKRIGRQLVEHLIAFAPSVNIQNIIAVVFAHNDASVRLCQQLGFQQWGYLPAVCDLGERMADVLILGLPLNRL